MMTASNKEVLQAIFDNVPENQWPMIAGFKGDPNKQAKGWQGQAFSENTTTEDPSRNWYTTLALYVVGDDGRVHHKKENCAAVLGVMLDDVGTEKTSITLDGLRDLLPPSMVVETSPDNYQASYLFDAPCTVGEVKLLNEGVIALGFCDKGATSPATRWQRLPFATNGKNGFECKLVEFEPKRRYPIAQIAKALGVTLDRHTPRRSVTPAPSFPQADEHARALSALACLSSDCEYPQWFKRCASARAAGLSEDDIRRWSSTSDRFKPDSFRKMWASIEDGKYTAGSLFHEARTNGWQDPQQTPRKHGAVTFPPLDCAAPQPQEGQPQGAVTLPPVGEPPAMTEKEEELKSAVLAIPPSARSPEGKHSALAVIGLALRHTTSGVPYEVGLHIAQAWDAMNCPNGERGATSVFMEADPNYAGKPLTTGSIYKMAQENGWVKPTTGADDDNHRNAPRPDPACLYGIVGDVARAAHAGNKEVNPYAAALGFMVALSAGVGRGCFLQLGDDRHHPRLLALHVGRSGRGRKGTALKLTECILKELDENDKYVDVRFPSHTGGLATREGLVMLIHDGFTVGLGANAEKVEPIPDKRLMVIETEFVNVLHQGARDGNTLSAAVRDVWDGKGIKPAIKKAPVGVKHPHCNIIGHITPSELLGSMKERELSNGFANRFMMIWAEQVAFEPFPKGTPAHVVNALADKVADVLRWAGADRFADRDHTQIDLTNEARDMYAKLYRKDLRDRSGGERVTGLLERRAPYLLRLAMLFAITDQTRWIEPKHITAALAWVKYWAESVRFIFATAQEEHKAEQTEDTAARIMDYLHQHGEVTRTQLANDCFKKRLPKDVLDAAIHELLTATPPRIVVEQRQREGRQGSPTKIYKKPLAESAECAESVAGVSANDISDGVRNVRSLRNLKNPDRTQAASSPEKVSHSADSADSADPKKQAQHLEPQHIPQNPQIPQGKNGNPKSEDAKSEDDGEVL